MSNIDQQFVEYVVKSLVNHPDEVVIERTIDEKGVLLKLSVNPEDLGRVIGKRGVTAQSIRTLLRALGTKNDARYNFKIMDDGDDRPPRRDDRDNSTPSNDDSSDDESKVEEEVVEEAVAETAEEVVEEVVEEVEEEKEEEEEEEEKSLTEKTREELAEFDDLEI